MKLILVKDGSTVVGKEVHEGDDETVSTLIETQRLDNPDLSYEEVGQKIFDAAEMTVIPSKETSDWQSAKSKGIDAAISFIAAKLGLE